jgi:hypothetical protein
MGYSLCVIGKKDKIEHGPNDSLDEQHRWIYSHITEVSVSRAG